MWWLLLCNHTTKVIITGYRSMTHVDDYRGESIKSNCDKSCISESYTVAAWLITDKSPVEYAVESGYWYAFILIPRSSSEIVFQSKVSLVSVPLWVLCLACSML